MPEAAVALEVVPTGGPLGAEVHGVDLARDQPGAVVYGILQAFADYQVLIFRDQDLTRERQLAVSEWFGPTYVPPADIPVLGDASQPPVVPVSNVVEGGVLGKGAIAPHSDLQYMPVPLLGAMLHAVEVPAEGGDTSWANLYMAYEELDAATKAQVADLQVWAFNPYAGRFAKLDVAGPNQKVTDAEVPRFHHPVVRTHPVTGRKVLYVSSLSLGLAGLPDPSQERAFLQQLRRHADQPHLYYTHRWRPGDVVVWDNRCTNHKRADFDATQRRVMYRTQIAGTRPF